MTENIYRNLREFLDKLPGGFPETPTGVEIKLLKKLFSPEQAELAVELRREPEECSAIAARTGISEDILSERLEEMARKGLIFRTRKGDRPLYNAEQFIIGIYEFQAMNKDPEFYDLFEQYLPYLGLSLSGVKTPMMRYIPIESALTPETEIATYDRVRDLISGESVIAVQQCICKQTQGFQGNECPKPQEVCFGFGEFAQFIIDNGMGREITRDEAFAILKRAEDEGLVLGLPNAQKLSFLCCCCSCCCPNLRFSKRAERPVDMVFSNHRAEIDPELCTSCDVCVERCQMEAILADGATTEILEGRCIGCGLCVSSCPEDAITLKVKEGVEAPPKDFKEVFDRVASERGL